MPSPLFSVGQLADRTGLTVRTLHHYDEIGLLRPNARTAAGHRRYGADAVARLQQIASLRALGFGLGAIADLLDRPGADPIGVVEQHRTALATQIAEAEQLRERLGRIAAHLHAAEHPSLDLLLTTIHLSTMFEKHYTPEQLQQLKEREATVGPEHIDAVQKEWADLFADFDRHREAGTPPEGPALAPLVERARTLIGEFTGGDAGIRESLNEAYAENKAEMYAAWGITPEAGAYYGRAMDAHAGDGASA